MVPCDDCDQTGEVIDKNKQCKTCKGKKVNKEVKKLTVTVDKGTASGEKQVLHGEADDLPDMEPGDVVCIIYESGHKTFKRKGADLVINKEISLLEALTGVDFVITHLDGRKIRIKNNIGDVIKPDDIKTVVGQGMPLYRKSYEFGNLFVKFSIIFPKDFKNTDQTN